MTKFLRWWPHLHQDGWTENGLPIYATSRSELLFENESLQWGFFVCSRCGKRRVKV